MAVLLENNADLDAHNDDGKTPCDLFIKPKVGFRDPFWSGKMRIDSSFSTSSNVFTVHFNISKIIKLLGLS